MRQSKNKFSKFLQKFSLKRKKNKFSRNTNYKLYKDQKQLDFGKKRKKILTFRFQIDQLKENAKKIIMFSVAFVAIITLLGIIYIFTGPTFRIKVIEATKQDSYIDLNIAYKSMENIYGKIIFNLDAHILLERLISYQENIKSISLKKKLPNTLYVEISSYEPIFNISINKRNFILLQNGSIVPTIASNPELVNLGIENTFGNKKSLAYKKIYSEKDMTKIQDIIKKIRLNIPTTISPTFYEQQKELHLLLNNTTTSIFSLDTDISVKEQIKNLVILHKEADAILNGKNVYIDVRIKNKAFICSYENEANCHYNLAYLYPDIEHVQNTVQQENQ